MLPEPPHPTTRDQPERPPAPTTVDPSRPAAAELTTRDHAGPAPGVNTAGLPGPVFERYQPVSGLAAGGEAHLVMLVRDRTSGAHRVVKVYGAAVRPDPALFERLQRADPEHLVRLHGWGELTDEWNVSRCWEILEYVPSGSVADLIRSEGPRLPDDLVRAVLREVAAALAYMHRDLAGPGRPGLAHRDVKPENALVRRRHPLDLVLCDFGLVSAVRATRVSAGRGGTPLYQAPETWWRKSGEPAQDWWSLGIMVAEMLIGHNPNTGPDGTAPDERVLFEHLATHDVDLSGIPDPRWQLLCRGLLTRSPEDRWGPAQVAQWLAGGSPTVHTGSAPVLVPRAGGADRPFELAGVLCTDLRQLAVAMHREPRAAAELFLDRTRRLDLRTWLDDHFEGGGIPLDLVRTDATGQAEADRRVARLVSQVAPELPPQYAGHRADAAGLASLAQRAVAGDEPAGRVVAQVTGGLLAALRRHQCRTAGHPDCPPEGGCTVLGTAARELDPALAAVQRRREKLSQGDYRGSQTRTAIQQVEALARATTLNALVDPAALSALRRRLRRQRRAGRSAWWAALARDASAATATGTTGTTGTTGERIAATVLAVLLLPAAESEDAVRRSARRANRRRGRAGRQRPPLARAVRADAVNLALAAILSYLASFIATGAYLMFVLEDSPENSAIATEYISAVQAPLLPPLLVLLGCLLVRPVEPRTAVNRAVLLPIGVAVASVAASWAGHPDWAGYPVVVSPHPHDWLAAVNGRLGTWFVVVGLVVYAPALFYLIARLNSRSWRTPAATRRPAATALRLAVFLAVVLAYVLGMLHKGPFATADSIPVVLWR
jgi:hypothetical protein